MHVLVQDRDDHSARSYQWTSPECGLLTPGSPAHQTAFCRMLLETYNPYRPAIIEWPPLSPDELKRISELPFWDTAVAIEERASIRMGWLAANTRDLLIREALKLNAAEEDRHKDVLLHMLAAYGIRVAKGMQQKRPLDPELGFLRTGYGECINSFFAFGLFEMARRSGFFPPALVDTFEPIVQEEARHILFFANYLAHRRATLGGLGYLTFQGKCVIAILEQIMSRLSMAIRAQRSARQTIDRGSMRSDFLNDGARSVAGNFDKRSFMRLCLAENDRRMRGFDRRLQRPCLVPNIIISLLKVTDTVLAVVGRGSA